MRKSARLVAAVGWAAASLGALALASCVTKLTYVREDAGKDAADDGSNSDSSASDGNMPDGAKPQTCSKFVLVGGKGTESAPPGDTTWVGEIQNDDNVMWKPGPGLPYPTAQSAAITLGDQVFTVGGYIHYTSATVFTTTSSAGTLPKGTLPTNHSGAECTAAPAAGGFYVLCNVTNPPDGGSAFFGTPMEGGGVPKLVVATASTLQVSSGVSVGVNGKVLVISTSGSMEIGAPSGGPESLSWTSAGSIRGRQNACATASGDRVYVVGGNTDPGIEVLKVRDATVTKDYEETLPKPIARSACIVANGRLWVFGGVVGSEVLRTVYSTSIDQRPFVWKESSLGSALYDSVVACLP